MVRRAIRVQSLGHPGAPWAPRAPGNAIFIARFIVCGCQGPSFHLRSGDAGRGPGPSARGRPRRHLVPTGLSVARPAVRCQSRRGCGLGDRSRRDGCALGGVPGLAHRHAGIRMLVPSHSTSTRTVPRPASICDIVRVGRLQRRGPWNAERHRTRATGAAGSRDPGSRRLRRLRTPSDGSARGARAHARSRSPSPECLPHPPSRRPRDGAWG